VRGDDGAVIPVERKRTHAPKRQYDSDLIQAFATPSSWRKSTASFLLPCASSMPIAGSMKSTHRSAETRFCKRLNGSGSYERCENALVRIRWRPNAAIADTAKIAARRLRNADVLNCALLAPLWGLKTDYHLGAALRIMPRVPRVDFPCLRLERAVGMHRVIDSPAGNSARRGSRKGSAYSSH
jgi:hypothetical protein